jgi:uncharacterized RDD family membrane protein YckC
VDLEDRMVTATPEGVSVEVVLAGIGSRFSAIMLDTAIQAAVFYVVALALVLGVAPATTLVVAGLASVAFLLVFFGYFVLFECLAEGRTVGKMAAGLRAVRVDGAPVGFRRSVVRTVLRLVDYPTLGLFIVGTARNQRLGDLAAGTVVVRERRAAAQRAPASAWAAAPVPHGASAPAPAVFSAYEEPLDARAWDVTAVSAEQQVLVERFLRSRFAYTAAARTALAARLANQLAPLVAGAPPDLPAERFLEGVAAKKVGSGWAIPASEWGWRPRR